MPTHVLVVDDDSGTCETLRVLLEDAGYLVLEATDGAVALDVLHTSPDSLVVLFDYRMPHMDGAALMALAEREHVLVQQHVFVCMTASPMSLPPTLAALLTHYDVPVVAKPFDIEAMLAVIGQAEERLARLPAPEPVSERHTP